MKGVLILENGQKFYGNMLMDEPAVGEVVFNTGMTGYQETFTDPSYAGQIITWGTFITAVNDKLKHLRVNEDRLIGPYFIKPSELHNKSAIDKLLLYLWDDVLRHKRDQGAFAKSITGFSDLVDDFESSDVLAIKDYIQYEPTPVYGDEDEEIEETEETT